MICGYNGKGCFSLSLTNMPPLRLDYVWAKETNAYDRDVLKITARKSNDPNDWTQFKKLRNIVNSEIRLAKQAYYQNSFNQYKGDSRKTWQTINELTSRKSGKTAVTSLKVNRVSITNPTELSNEFNNHLLLSVQNLAVTLILQMFYHRYITSTDQCFQLRPTSVNKVFSLLNKLNKSKAIGLDKISARLIRECAALICVLFVIFLTNQLV